MELKYYMDQHEHPSEPGKFMAIRDASGALRGVAQHDVTPLCIPLCLPRLPPPQLVPRIAGFATSFLPFHLLAHISHRRSSQLQSLLGQQGSSAVPWSHKNQDPSCFPVCPGVSPSPDSSWEQRAWPWSSCPVHATDPHSKQITALETVAPGRHEPPIICKQPDWLVLQDFCKVCFPLPYSSSCPRASR